MSYVIYSNSFSFEHPEREKRAHAYVAPGIGNENRRDALQEHTDILGQSVYDSDGEVIGTLYDAYVDIENGQVKWVSINAGGNLNSPVILMKADKFSSLGDNNKRALAKTTKQKFLEYPVQNVNEKRLINYISLRNLPNTDIMDFDGKKVGTLKSLTYKNGYIDRVFFQAKPLEKLAELQMFSIPFKHLKFVKAGSFRRKFIGVALSERQIGALRTYMRVE